MLICCSEGGWPIQTILDAGPRHIQLHAPAFPTHGNGSAANAVSQKSLSRLKDGKVIGVVDEDAPEKPGRQDTVESLYAGILLDASEAEEGHAGQFE